VNNLRAPASRHIGNTTACATAGDAPADDRLRAMRIVI
jgi:hypothetical protein